MVPRGDSEEVVVVVVVVVVVHSVEYGYDIFK